MFSLTCMECMIATHFWGSRRRRRRWSHGAVVEKSPQSVVVPCTAASIVRMLVGALIVARIFDVQVFEMCPHPIVTASVFLEMRPHTIVVTSVAGSVVRMLLVALVVAVVVVERLLRIIQTIYEGLIFFVRALTRKFQFPS